MISFLTSYERDPVLFCQFRRNPEEVKNEVAWSRQLGGLEKIDIETCMRNADIVPVLRWIWCHEDAGIPLSWLRKKHEDGHAILYYERAIAEFKEFPAIETLHEVCLPLIKQANFLVTQECVRLKGSKLCKMHLTNTIVEDIEKSYMLCLENLSLSSLGKGVDDISDEEMVLRQQRIVEAVKEVATRSLERKPIRISWLRWYGLEKDCGDEERQLEDNCEDLANRCASFVLKKLGE